MAVNYEWIVEEVDEHDDILDVNHHVTRAAAEAQAAEGPQHGGVGMAIALVRDVWNEYDGVTDRSWAYLRDGKLPSHFSSDDREGAPVPKRFL